MERHLDDVTILVVEDERPLAQAINKKLEKEGFTVLSARTVEQALGYLEDDDFARVGFVWLDHYLLGEKTGLDFVAECKKEGSKLRNVPIFVVTNTGSYDKEQTYLQLGADKYYIKSNYRLDQIIGDIKEQLE